MEDGQRRKFAGSRAYVGRVPFTLCLKNSRFLHKNRGIYIKLGQVIGSFNHVLPIQYTETLRVLYNGVKARPYKEVENVFKREFGKKPTEMFKEFDKEAFAAASLSQVHTAVTKEGEKVAVKVQYEDLQDNFKSDLRTLQFLVDAVAYLNPRFNLKCVIENAFKSITKELDFEIEAANSERCARDLAHLKFVKIPRVHQDLSTSTILTMNFAEGFPITDTEQITRAGLDLRDISEKVVTMFAEQIFRTGFVHADPHPGNILIQKDGRKPVLVLLDHGLYQEYDKQHRRSLCGFYKSIMTGNIADLRKFSLQLGVEDHSIFAQIISQKIVGDSTQLGIPAKLSEEELKVMKDNILKNMDKILAVLSHIPSDMLLIIRNIHFVRTIVRGHGNLVNRHRILTSCAISGYEELTPTWVPCALRKAIKQSELVFKMRYRSFVNFMAKLFMGLYLYFTAAKAAQLMEIQSAVGEKMEKTFSSF